MAAGRGLYCWWAWVVVLPLCGGCLGGDLHRLDGSSSLGRPKSNASLLLAQNPADWQLPTAPARNVSRPAAAPLEPKPAMRAVSETVPSGPAPFTVPVTPTPIHPPAPAPPSNSAVLSAPSNPAGNPTAANALAPLRELQQHAVAAYAPIDSYIVRLQRREVVNGKRKPAETILLKYRRQPLSVYFKWLDGEARGREVTFVQGRYESKIHTLLAAGDIPLMPAGKRISLAPDSPLIRTSSRHSITDAGIGPLIDKFGMVLEANEHGDPRAGSLKYLGPIRMPEMQEPYAGVEQFIPAGLEPGLPRGGRRLWLFNPTSRLPAVITTYDDAGQEVEHYVYDRIQHPVKLDDADFNPDKLGAPAP